MHSLLLLLLAILPACGGQSDPGDAEVAVEVDSLALDSQHSPVVILEETAGLRRLPIWIGPAEARSIAIGVERHELPRPNTHDLMKRVLDGLGGEVMRVVVTRLESGTYYATLFVRAGGDTVEVDSRPSDAIALALRTNAPIFVRASLFESAVPTGAAESEQEI